MCIAHALVYTFVFTFFTLLSDRMKHTEPFRRDIINEPFQNTGIDRTDVGALNNSIACLHVHVFGSFCCSFEMVHSME